MPKKRRIRSKKTAPSRRFSLLTYVKGWLAVIGGVVGIGIMIVFLVGNFNQPEEISIFEGKISSFADIIEDKFLTDIINPDIWSIWPTPNSSISIDRGRLKMAIFPENTDHWTAGGTNKIIEPDKNFTIEAYLYMPQVEGAGIGQTNFAIQQVDSPYSWLVSIGLERNNDVNKSSIYLTDFNHSKVAQVNFPPRRIPAFIRVQITRRGNLYAAKYYLGNRWLKLGNFSVDNSGAVHPTLAVNRDNNTTSNTVTGWFDNFKLTVLRF